jgi:hypothetical protein
VVITTRSQEDRIMSTKRIITILVAALALTAISATAAQARPAGVGVHRDAGATVQAAAGAPTINGHLASGHVVSTGTTSITAPAPVTSAAARPDGDISRTQIAELAGLTLVGVVLIAGWAAGRFGGRVRPIPH